MAIENNSSEINRALIDLALSTWSRSSKLIFQLDTWRVVQLQSKRENLRESEEIEKELLHLKLKKSRVASSESQPFGLRSIIASIAGAFDATWRCGNLSTLSLSQIRSASRSVWIGRLESDRLNATLEDAYLVYWLFILIVYKIYLFSS